MRKTLSLIATSSLFFQLLPFAVGAVFHEALQQGGQETPQELQQKRDALRDEVKERRERFRQEFEERAKALRAEFEKRREEFEKKREALKQEIRQRREKFQEEAKARRDELKKRVGEKRAENIEKFFNRMVGKFEAAIERLKRSADRIEGRIGRAEANGKDVSDPRSKLLSAREKIADAEKALEDAKVKYSEAVKEADFSVAFKKVRGVVAGVKEKVKAAHRALVEAVTSLKGLGKGEKPAETLSAPSPEPAPTQ